jgi:Mycothiol maleylpyruvate isomerase N-terminal domain
MWSVMPDRQAVSESLTRESEHIVGLVRGCPDLAAPVPGLAWTVGRLAAHMTSVYLAFGGAVRGEYQDPGMERAVAAAGEGAELPRALAAANEYAVGVLAAPDARSAADAIAAQAAVLFEALAAAQDLSRERATPWYGLGSTRSVGALASIAVTESLVHGRDLARAVRADTKMSRISAAAATPTLLSVMLPYLLDKSKAKGLRADYELRLRGTGRRFVVRVAEGEAECFEAGGRDVDCVITMDPCAALLVGLGRSSVARATLTGGARSAGRKPWLGPRFPGMFAKP